MMDLTSSLGKFKLLFPVMNASGILGATESELTRVLESGAGAVVIKSTTLEKRPGNEGVRYYMEQVGSINSMGFPNQGIRYYCDIIRKLNKHNKPVILSIAGFSEAEFVRLIMIADRYPFSAFEINLSCPNIVGKNIFAFDFQTTSSILKKVRKKTKKIIGIKLPPYSQRSEIQLMTKILLDEGVDFMTTMNTYPLSCFVDWKSEQMRIKPNMGIGGLGGNSIKPISLAQVVLFRQFTEGKLPIIGVGGITSAQDVYEFILAGASAVQIGTDLIRKGPNLFKTIRKDLIQILEEKRVKKLSDKIGKLKFL